MSPGDPFTARLRIPPPAPDEIERPRLLEGLENRGLALLLVAAPAGSGKTTLLAQWSRTTSRPVAWLSLVEDDNDPARFFRDLRGSLASALPNLHAVDAPATDALSGATYAPRVQLRRLLDAVGTGGDPLALVLDDYHVIDNPEIHEALRRLLTYPPPHLLLALGTRTEPPLGLARLRAHGRLHEIRVRQLRFSTGEVDAFLSRADLALDDGKAAALNQRTEGWAAGVRLAAHYLRHRVDPAAALTSFTGASPYVLEYLVEEVLNRQSPERQAFLLETSILNGLCAPLCDAVRRESNSGEQLDALSRDNLFLIPRDVDRSWLRYHSLFGRALRHQLARRHPELLPTLHRRAAAWYADHDFPGEAVRHALAAGDAGAAARLIVRYAMPTLQRGEQFTLLRWIESLDVETRRQHPALSLWYAWVLLFVGRVEEHEAPLADAEGTWRRQEDAHGIGRALAFRANLARLRGDAQSAIDLAKEALSLLPEGDVLQRGTCRLALGQGYAELGDAIRAQPILEDAAATGRSLDNLLIRLIARNRRADTFLLRGRLSAAEQAYERVLEMAGDRPVWQRAEAHTGLARIRREQNRLEEAVQHLDKALQIAADTDRTIYLADTCLVQAEVAAARRNEEEAFAALARADQTARAFRQETVRRRIASVRALFQLRQGDRRSAGLWAESVARSPAENRLLHEREASIVARIWLAEERVDEARELLHSLVEPARAGGRDGSLVEITWLRAAVARQGGDEAEMLAAAQEALGRGEPAGYRRLFLDDDASARALLIAARDAGIQPHFVEALLADLAPAPALDEPLTPRELDVLALVARGFTNRQIADELVIALTTAKKHVSNILGKLGVDNRTEAAARARELGIL